MNWRIEFADAAQNVALFVSQYLHCLADLLLRHQAGEFRCNLALIVSNHEAARPLAEFHGIPFHFMPVTRDNKAKVEAAQLALLAKHKIDLIVLARYMQVLSPKFVAAYPRRIINVHHSFLPAFTGASPYHAAFERGVKLIGATSHYVTETAGRRPHHRAGRHAHLAERPASQPHPEGPRSGAHGPLARRAVAPRPPHPQLRQQDRHLRLICGAHFFRRHRGVKPYFFLLS